MKRYDVTQCPDTPIYQLEQELEQRFTAPLPQAVEPWRAVTQPLSTSQPNDCYWHQDAWPFEGWDSVEDESPARVGWFDRLVNWLVKLRG
jgi:hypothetical protein